MRRKSKITTTKSTVRPETTVSEKTSQEVVEKPARKITRPRLHNSKPTKSMGHKSSHKSIPNRQITSNRTEPLVIRRSAEQCKIKYKKALVIDVGGPEGIWSNMRGEGRWNANAAVLFRKYGMDVDILASSKVSDDYRDKQEGINFINTFGDKDYDLFFCHRPFYKEEVARWGNMSKKIKKAIFGTFWPGINDHRPSNDSILVSPYRAFCSDSRVLPYTYSDELESPKFENKTIVWTTRGPFNSSVATSTLLVNLYHLRATLEAARNGFKVIFLCFDASFMIGKDPGFFTEVSKILAELKTNPNVEFYEGISQDKFSEILSRGSIVIRCDAGGTMTECLLRGLVPTVFTPWFWPVYFNEASIEGLQLFSSYSVIPEATVRDRVFSLLTDKSFFESHLDILRKHTPVFTTQQALSMLTEILTLL